MVVSGSPPILSQLADWAEGGFGASQTGPPESRPQKIPMAKFTPGRVCSCLSRRRSRNIGFFHPKISAKMSEPCCFKGKTGITWISLNSWCEGGVSRFPDPGSCFSHKDKTDQVELVWFFVIVIPAMNSELSSREEATVHP